MPKKKHKKINNFLVRQKNLSEIFLISTSKQHARPQPEQTADISGRHHWFLREIIITSEKRLQKFDTDDRPGCAPDWLKQISFTVRPIRITTQIWIVTHFCSRFSDVVSRGETSGGVAKCRLFSSASMAPRSPFCIFSDSCRIKVLLAKRYPYWLQTTT